MTEPHDHKPDETTLPVESILRNAVADAFMAFKKEGEAGVERVISMNPQFSEQIRRRLNEAHNMGILNSANDTSSAPPDQIGEYEILDIIGSGGMGVVYRAEQKRLGRIVALKVLRGHATASEKTRQRFLREARVASHLNHPGLCTVYELGEDDEIPFIAMEYIEGEPLDKRISRMTTGAQLDTESFEDFEKNEPVTDGAVNDHEPESSTQVESVDELLRIFESALRALDAGHETGMIHRDLKPSNIIVRTNGEPVILDFGLAIRPDSDDLTLTQVGDILGTPAYMSPEQVTQAGAPLDRRTDIYSMGVSLYHCVTGHRPFVAASRQTLFRDIIEGLATPPRQLNKNISKDLEVVLATAMETDRERRYQTAAAFADDIDCILTRRPIAARPASILLRTWRWGQRNPVTATLTAALLIFLATFSITLSFKNQELDQQRNELSDTLSRLTRLADSRKLEELIATADELWPARPETVAQMDAWIDDTKKLLRDADQHSNDLASLRGSSLPYTATDQRRDHPLEALRQDELTRSEASITALSDGTTDEQRADVLDDWLDIIEKEKHTLSETLNIRETWRFAEGKQLEWRFGLLRELVQRIELLRSLLRTIQVRRAFAASIHSRSVTNASDHWNAAAKRLQANQRFEGFNLQAITGLLPLGPDPHSQLEEFLHLDTHKGPVPERDADGQLPFSSNCGIVLALIPGGDFFMGAQRVGTVNVDPNAIEERESPVNRVTLSPFLIARHELTVGQWNRFKRLPASELPALDTLPIGNIRWLEAHATLTHMDLSIPSEAQWERAARADTTSIWWTGNETDSLRGAANLADQAAALAGRTWPSIKDWKTVNDGFELTAPVHAMRPNGFGLHHIHGNVAEWCQDAFQGYVAPALPSDGLRTLVPATTRVIRGGSYYSSPHSARSAVRSHDSPEARSPIIGVRPARSINMLDG